ncbi:hypothetical protein EDC65_3283 [Stella humosa]|uniref:Uncharacterized protein n=1 Tax=Stella humosa TaxID=94 RepID=A0A3N1KTM3_9PROT|nr:hypothetical protein [Stella humosa]ROP83941.1 hypothetical protein EDC65_3283 [Stella humosa]BBK33448.1 hypothetical protein STHU_40820 [Stella humosa]
MSSIPKTKTATIAVLPVRSTEATLRPRLDIPVECIARLAEIVQLGNADAVADLKVQIELIGARYLRQAAQDTDIPLTAGSRRLVLKSIAKHAAGLRDALRRVDHITEWQLYREQSRSHEDSEYRLPKGGPRAEALPLALPLEGLANRLNYLQLASEKALLVRGTPGSAPRISEGLLVRNLCRLYETSSGKAATHHANEGRTYSGRVQTPAGRFVLLAAQAINPQLVERNIVTLLPTALAELRLLACENDSPTSEAPISLTNGEAK